MVLQSCIYRPDMTIAVDWDAKTCNHLYDRESGLLYFNCFLVFMRVASFVCILVLCLATADLQI